MNPLKQFRLALTLTQEQLAEKAGVTKQTVVDTEQGLFPRIPPSLVQATGVSQKDYREWVKLTRQSNLRELAVDLTRVDSFRDYTEQVAGSTRGFARVLVIQTSVVRDYIAHGLRWEMVDCALREAGVPDDLVVFLSKLDRE